MKLVLVGKWKLDHSQCSRDVAALRSTVKRETLKMNHWIIFFKLEPTLLLNQIVA